MNIFLYSKKASGYPKYPETIILLVCIILPATALPASGFGSDHNPSQPYQLPR